MDNFHAHAGTDDRFPRRTPPRIPMGRFSGGAPSALFMGRRSGGGLAERGCTSGEVQAVEPLAVDGAESRLEAEMLRGGRAGVIAR